MYLVRWFNRKYPKSKAKIWHEFYHRDDEYIRKLKNENYKVGILTEDFGFEDDKYKKGTMVLYKRIKDCSEGSWNGCFDTIGIFKCNRLTMTHSGFHMFRISHIKLTELTK